MNNIERILKLKKQEQEIKDEIETLEKRLDYKEWKFYVHTNYRAPRISAWKQNRNTSNACCFAVKEGRAKLYSAGTYQDNWEEAHAIINKGLVGGSSSKPKEGRVQCTQIA